MKNLRKVSIIAAVVLVVGATGVTGFAASAYQSPAEAVAGITGQTVESVIAERQETNKTYGKIAADAGKLDEFKVEAMEMKKDRLNAQVADGKITQEKADTIIKTIEENQANCDGSGSKGEGQEQGARFGMRLQDGSGEGQGK
jgi:Tfp pilus assembly protein PilV